MKFLALFLLFTFEFLLPYKSSAQNLFANPGFEDINRCVEFHADCAPEAWFNMPATNFLVKGLLAPKPVLGQMVLLLPVGSVLPSFKKPRFTYTMLLCPLVKGEQYELSFFINTGRKAFNGLQLFFTNKEPDLFSLSILDRSFSVTLTAADIDDERKGWQHINKKFTATGNESFFLLPNKPVIEDSYEMKDAMNSSGDVFYFLDEVILKPVTALPLCEQASKNKELLYAQNFRHSDNPVVNRATIPVPKMVFVKDTINIPSVLFDVNSAVLKPAVQKILDSVVQVIADQKIAQVDVNGHTDNTGTVQKNEQLAIGRANAVRAYLVTKSPAIEPNIFAAGKGQTMPIASNTTTEGRSRNRRVEVIITRVKLSP